MPSDAAASTDARSRPNYGALYRLLDPVFGFFVWAAYFLIVYVGQATVCSLWPGMSAPERTVVKVALVAATLVAIGVIAAHGWLRYRQRGPAHDSAFRTNLAVGLDGLAGVASAWMLIPILFTPLCA